MSLNTTPQSQRCHIAFFGLTNSGKSSLINKIASQNVSLVSDIKGTTTDPVKKSMELLPLGPVVLIDTAGIDDKTPLGKMRVGKTLEVLSTCDIAVFVKDGTNSEFTDDEKDFTEKIKKRDVPFFIVYTKADLIDKKDDDKFYVSSENGYNINELKEKIASVKLQESKTILEGLINKGDKVILVIPIDESAPKGRIILPQQMAIRDILDKDAVSICVKDDMYEHTLKNLIEKPDLVICDSQVFKKVSDLTPKDVPLTSFSILMARMKGFLSVSVDGAKHIDNLKDNDKVLISEGCTHHRQCNDIGTKKIPALLKKYTNKDLDFVFTQGKEFPEDLSSFSLVIHCGGCMITDNEVKMRMDRAQSQNVKFTNYGISIAHMNSILDKSIFFYISKY